MSIFNKPEADADACIKIVTLGDFDIRYRGKSLLNHIQRCYKLLELLRYFITFRQRRMLPEAIIDDLWPRVECDDPKNTLRVQVYRLRQALKEIAVAGEFPAEPCFNLGYANGYYFFEMGPDCRLDTEVFEDSIRRAEETREKGGGRGDWFV